MADTQVVLDWLVFRDATARPLLQAMLEGRLRWLATPAMRTELEHMLRHPALARWGHRPELAIAFFECHATLHGDPVPASKALARGVRILQPAEWRDTDTPQG